MSEKTRPVWESYFMGLAEKAAERSTCLRRQVGALAVRDKRILASGYNGSPPGTMHCLDIGCKRQKENIPSGERHEKCRANHAEQNLIIQAALHGVSLKGADIYCTTQPCVICAKLILGIMPARVLYTNPYPDEDAIGFFSEVGNSYKAVIDNVEMTIWDFSLRG